MISNNGPKEANEYISEAEMLEKRLADISELSVNDDVAAQLNDLMSDARTTAKNADNDRKAIKEPFLSAGREVDGRFKVVTTRIDKVVSAARSILTPYLAEQAKKAAEAERRAREEAEAKARAAEALKNDESGEIIADMAQKAKSAHIAAMAKADMAGRIGSATGMSRTASLRTYYDAVIVDPVKAATFYAANPKVRDVIASLAEAEMRSDKTKSITIPGIEFHARQEAA